MCTYAVPHLWRAWRPVSHHGHTANALQACLRTRFRTRKREKREPRESRVRRRRRPIHDDTSHPHACTSRVCACRWKTCWRWWGGPSLPYSCRLSNVVCKPHAAMGTMDLSLGVPSRNAASFSCPSLRDRSVSGVSGRHQNLWRSLAMSSTVGYCDGGV